jgi:hypothetical protein
MAQDVAMIDRDAVNCLEHGPTSSELDFCSETGARRFEFYGLQLFRSGRRRGERPILRGDF